MQDLQLLSHLAQNVLDLSGSVQDLRGAGVRVVSDGERLRDGGGVPPGDGRSLALIFYISSHVNILKPFLHSLLVSVISGSRPFHY